MHTRDGVVGVVGGALASGVLLLASFFSNGLGLFNRTIEVNTGGGAVTISAPSPAELSCPEGWQEVQRGVTHLDGIGPADIGYVACDRFPYSLTRVLGGADQLTKAWGENVGWVTDPEEVQRIVGGQ